MRLSNLIGATLVALVVVLLAPAASATLGIEHEDIGWTTTSAGTVVFNLRFSNPGPDTSAAATGVLYSQDFGAFVPRFGEIGTFTVPRLAPDSFFDIVFEVPLGDLPPSAANILPGTAPAPGVGAAPAACPPDDHWDGNVDVVWTDPAGGGGEVWKHYGTLQVCPGAGNSYIHIVTACSGPVNWNFGPGCPGYAMTLVNEDFTAAPNPVPPGWSGFLCVSADASVNIGTVCCFPLYMVCGNDTVQVDFCVEACDWGSVPVEPVTWGHIKALYR